MRESLFARLWNLVKPPPAVRDPGAPQRKLQPRQKQLLIGAASFLILTGAAWGAYSFVAGAPQRAEVEFQAAMKFMQPGQYQNAIPRFTRAIQIHEMASAYLERGVAHRYLGHADQAIGDFQRAIDLDASLARAYSSLGSIYRDRGDTKSAVEQFSKSLAISPNVDAMFERGEMYEAIGEHQKAIDDFTAAIDGIRDAPYIYRARSLAKRNLGDIAGYEADRDQARAIERPPRR
jgi:tetratricopeptide (TPR) repeat protein